MAVEESLEVTTAEMRAESVLAEVTQYFLTSLHKVAVAVAISEAVALPEGLVVAQDEVTPLLQYLKLQVPVGLVTETLVETVGAQVLLILVAAEAELALLVALETLMIHLLVKVEMVAQVLLTLCPVHLYFTLVAVAETFNMLLGQVLMVTLVHLH
jgi:hypothetical protein